MKRNIRLLVLFCVGFLVVPVSAKQTIVIGDFEGRGSDQYDGWIPTGANPVFAGDDIGRVWSSAGTGSCAIKFNSSNGFQWNLKLTDDVLAKLADDGRVVADVYWRTSDWSGDRDMWVRWDIMAFNSSVTGWVQATQNHMIDKENPDFPGSWDMNNWGGAHKRTISWDFSELLAGYNSEDILNDTNFFGAQIYMSVNGDSQTLALGTLYIDNIRIVHELIPYNCINPPSMDTNGDCQIDLVDLAEFARQWMTCGYENQADCWN